MNVIRESRLLKKTGQAEIVKTGASNRIDYLLGSRTSGRVLLNGVQIRVRRNSDEGLVYQVGPKKGYKICPSTVEKVSAE